MATLYDSMAMDGFPHFSANENIVKIFQIIGMLGSRPKSESHKSRRKVCRSTSSVVSGRSSVTSRGTKDHYYRRSKQDFRHKYEES